MTWTRLLAIVLIAGVLLGGSAPSFAWAQNAPPAMDVPGTGAELVAGFSNVLFVPGKAIVCAGSGVIWFTIMFFTFGHSYNDAANFVKGGCGGKWALRGEDIKFSTSE